MSAPRPGDDPLQRRLVAFALALVAAILAAPASGCGGALGIPGDLTRNASSLD